MKVGLISDTHGKLRPQVFEVFRGVELILHAGDIGNAALLVELEAIAPVRAVLGNTDALELRQVARDELQLNIEGFLVVVVHGHLLGTPTPASLRREHPAADVIVYGHTHRQRIDQLDGCLVINPGAAGPARFDLKPAVALLTLERGVEPTVESIALV